MRLCAFAALVATSAFAGNASAFEPAKLDGEAVRVDVTEATTVLFNVDNRNTRPADVTRVADDEWSAWVNRLNLQANWRAFQVGLRLDSALFPTSPEPTDLALELLTIREGGSLPAAFDRADVDFFLLKLGEASRELSNRYINWVYPAKYYVGYSTPDVEVTAGDFYAQLGRGLVLSIRKLDELSSDTTVRGGRITARWSDGPFRLKLTGLGGVMNPLRIDEASGRYIASDDSVTTGLATVTEAGMPRPIDDALGQPTPPTYAPDQLFGAQLEGGTRHAQVGVQGSLLDRTFLPNGTALSPGVVRSAETISTGSISVNVPDFDEHGAGYIEVAGQDLESPTGAEIDPGYAVYSSLSLIERPVTATVEAKHYRRFFPLSASVDIGRAREFGVVQYSAPPTTEAFWIDTEFESMNTCVTGGRAKADVEVGKDESVFAWVGRYHTWAETVANEACDTADSNLNRVWDFAVGLEASSQRRRSRAGLTVGSRFDDTDRVVQDARGLDTTVFYREVYARYDVIRWLSGPFSLQLQGWHRRRRITLGGPEDAFFQGQHLTALQWSPHFVFGVGLEYDTNPAFPDTYVNGLLSYNIDSASNVSLFVGQRRGGLRCISGVCRVFPPFEGVRADATVRF